MRKKKIPPSFYKKLENFRENMQLCVEDIIKQLKTGVEDPENFNFKVLALDLCYFSRELTWLLGLIAKIAPE